MSTIPTSEDSSAIAITMPSIPVQIPMRELVQPTMIEFEVTDHDGDPCRFLAMRAHLCAYSKYFKTLFNGKFADTDTRTIKIKDHAPWVLVCFINWLYTQTLSLAGISERSLVLNGGDRENSHTWPYRTLFELYHLAEYYDITALRTAIIRQVQMNLIVNLQNPKPAGYPSREDIKYLVSVVPQESQLRRFLGSMAFNANFLFEYVDTDDYLKAIDTVRIETIKCESCRERRFDCIRNLLTDLSCPDHIADRHQEPYRPRNMCLPWHQHENEDEQEQCQEYMRSVTGANNGSIWFRDENGLVDGRTRRGSFFSVDTDTLTWRDEDGNAEYDYQHQI